mmetsp:Transcript_61295/g.71665  ORF Transcript_61295/g.71665 Transcript_61295/m.71665 type:complete len:478 (+) Transcript_61295:69-1502(+)
MLRTRRPRSKIKTDESIRSCGEAECSKQNVNESNTSMQRTKSDVEVYGHGNDQRNFPINGSNTCEIQSDTLKPFLVKNGKSIFSDDEIRDISKKKKILASAWIRLKIASCSLAFVSCRKKIRRMGKLKKVLLVLLAFCFGFSLFINLLDACFGSFGISSSTSLPMKDHGQETTFSGFAVVVNTFKRPEMLQDAIIHYAETCGKKSGVQHVYIVWCDLSEEPPSSQSFFEGSNGSNLRNSSATKKNIFNRSHINIMKMEKDSLNSRFLPISGLQTDGVFMVDDDVRVDCLSLKRGFEAWKQHSDALVGYYPRWHEQNGKEIIYHTYLKSMLKNKLSIILTKASFLHSKYLELYSNENHPQEIKDYVDANRNCEDIAMAMIVANSTKHARGTSSYPVYVEGNVWDKGLFGGISTGSGHFQSRTTCLTEISKIYEQKGWGDPLFDVTLTDQTWRQHFPGYWWQVRPSNLFEWFPSADFFM